MAVGKLGGVTPAFDLAFVGHFARDVIVDGGVRTWSSGGSVYYGAIAAKRLGASVAVVTKLAREDFEHLEEVRREGVEVFATEAPETSGIENTYATPDRNRRTCRPLGFAGPFSLSELPELRARYLVLGPIIAGEFDLHFLSNVSSKIEGTVALDVQGFVRVREGDRLVFRDWAEMPQGLEHVDVLKADDAEVEALTGRQDLFEGAEVLASFGPREVLVTRSDAIRVLAFGEAHECPLDARSSEGRTGRGDTAFASYLAFRLTHPPGEACQLAAAATSIKLERPGPLAATFDQVRARANL
ncbi:MAG: PfkB family carbohydrate kinase [Promethearchaeota archaeon]